MFDIGVNTFAEEDLSSDEIVFFDSEPTYEELLEINNELYRELYFMKYAKFEKEVQDGFEMFTNAFIACEYVQRHGIDDNISELIGNEGLLSNIKDVVVKFAKWLFGVIQKFVKWIGSLFSGTNANYTTANSSNYNLAAHKAAVILIRGSRSDKQKVIADIKKGVSNSKLAPGLKEGDTSRPTVKNIVIGIPENKRIICDVFEGITNDILVSMVDKTSTVSTNRVANGIKAIKNAVDGPQTYVTLSEAASWVLDVSNSATEYREIVMQLYDKLKKLPRLKATASESECLAYIKSVESSLKIRRTTAASSMNSDNAKMYQEKVSELFKLFRDAYSVETVVINYIKRVVTALYRKTFYFKGFEQQSGAIDVRVKIPNDLLERIRDAWKCDSLTINRLIISSTRVQFNDKSEGNTLWRSINGKLCTGKNVYISYQMFKTKLVCQKVIDECKQQIQEENIDPDKYHICLEPDRVKQFLLTLVHECRHIYQYTNNLHTKDMGKRTSSYKDSLEKEHEMDARKAAMNFVFKDEDVRWAEHILNKCIDEEIKQLRTVWKDKLSDQ